MVTSFKKASNVKTYDRGIAMRYTWSQTLHPGQHQRVVLVSIHRTWNGDETRDNVLQTLWPHVSPYGESNDHQN